MYKHNKTCTMFSRIANRSSTLLRSNKTFAYTLNTNNSAAYGQVRFAHADSEHYDLVVIGSGPAGQKCAIDAAKKHKRVALVDDDEMMGGKYICHVYVMYIYIYV